MFYNIPKTDKSLSICNFRIGVLCTMDHACGSILSKNGFKGCNFIQVVEPHTICV